MNLKVTTTFEFTEENIERAKIWAKSANYKYQDSRLLLLDALQAGAFQFDHVRLLTAKEAPCNTSNNT